MNFSYLKKYYRSDKTAEAIDRLGYDSPTEIQYRAIPHLVSGRDIIGLSQTGTGKTMAFAIPAADLVLASGTGKLQILCVCPTRELAGQVAREMRRLLNNLEGLSVAEVTGGVPIEPQISKLKKACVCVGTPGRILDHLKRGTLNPQNISFVVLDEADEMLEMGFIEDIRDILDYLPKEHTTALFSATMPEGVKSIAKAYLNEPEIIEINPEIMTATGVKQSFIAVPMNRKRDALELVLRYKSPDRCLIFCNTRSSADELNSYLAKHGFNCMALHGEIVQSQRSKIMERFKNGSLKLLIATDVAARGIDVKDMSLVINYDIPQSAEQYVHRIGRTGRAGKKGVALTLCSGKKQQAVIESYANTLDTEIKQENPPTVAKIKEKARNMAVSEIMTRASETDEYSLAIADRLLASGTEPRYLLSALVSKYFEDISGSLKDIPSSTDVTEITKHTAKSETVKMLIDIGRAGRVSPSHILSAVADASALPGKTFGKIEIYEDATTVEIPIEVANAVFDSMLGIKICGKPVHCELIAPPPKKKPRKPTTKKPTKKHRR